MQLPCLYPLIQQFQHVARIISRMPCCAAGGVPWPGHIGSADNAYPIVIGLAGQGHGRGVRIERSGCGTHQQRGVNIIGFRAPDFHMAEILVRRICPVQDDSAERSIGGQPFRCRRYSACRHILRVYRLAAVFVQYSARHQISGGHHPLFCRPSKNALSWSKARFTSVGTDAAAIDGMLGMLDLFMAYIPANSAAVLARWIPSRLLVPTNSTANWSYRKPDGRRMVSALATCTLYFSTPASGTVKTVGRLATIACASAVGM